jgi:hypothetical protein
MIGLLSTLTKNLSILKVWSEREVSLALKMASPIEKISPLKHVVLYVQLEESLKNFKMTVAE